MQFSTVRALVGWAFQMTEAIPVKVQKFAEAAPREYDALTPDELKMVAVDVMAKVGRLDKADQVVLAAYFTATSTAVREAAKLLPGGWPTAMRRELTRGWVDDQGLQRAQREIAETFMLSQQTVSDRWMVTQKTFNDLYHHGLKIIEPQVYDLIECITYRKPSYHAAYSEVLAFSGR
jgi:hypothetical protein